MLTRSLPGSPRGAFLACLALLVACDIPTSAPILDTRWALPGEETSIEISELLPDGVTLAPGGGGFLVETDPVRSVQTLGDLCSLCSAADGRTIPKPPFTASVVEVVELPDDVAAGSLTSGSVVIELTNGFAFDPLNPGGGVGSIEISIHAGGENGPVIGSEELVGGVDALPTGSTLEVTIALLPGTLSGITAVIDVVSPAGDPVPIDVSELLVIDGDARNLVVAEALIAVADRVVTLDPVDLDVGEVDDSFVDRIQKGSIWLNVDNAFGVTVHMELVIAGGGIPPITKTVTIPGGVSTQEVAFTAAELQSFFGVEGVRFSGIGAVGSSEPPLIAQPDMRAAIQADLDITLRFGS